MGLDLKKPTHPAREPNHFCPQESSRSSLFWTWSDVVNVATPLSGSPVLSGKGGGPFLGRFRVAFGDILGRETETVEGSKTTWECVGMSLRPPLDLAAESPWR